MAFRTWAKLLGTTLGVAALAGASQLGLAYGLGILRLTRVVDVAGRDQWTAQLAWVAWFAMTAAVIGGLAGRWLRDRWKAPATAGTFVALSLAAGLGAALVVPLTMQPARTARVDGVHPVFVIGICATLGAAAGIFAAYAVLTQLIARRSLTVTGIAVWALALLSVAPSLGPDDPLPAVRLGVFDAGYLSPALTQRTALFTMPALALITGAILGYAARRRELPILTIALAGLPGPALLTLSYLIAGPGAGADRYQVVPYWAAMTATGAGVLGSVLAAVIRRGPDDLADEDDPATAAARHADDTETSAPRPRHAGDDEPTAGIPVQHSPPPSALSAPAHASADGPADQPERPARRGPFSRKPKSSDKSGMSGVDEHGGASAGATDPRRPGNAPTGELPAHEPPTFDAFVPAGAPAPRGGAGAEAPPRAGLGAEAPRPQGGAARSAAPPRGRRGRAPQTENAPGRRGAPGDDQTEAAPGRGASERPRRGRRAAASEPSTPPYVPAPALPEIPPEALRPQLRPVNRDATPDTLRGTPLVPEPEAISAPIAQPEPSSPPLSVNPAPEKKSKKQAKDDEYVDWVSKLGDE
ncbi:hypothetical protein [Actinoplanes sp. NBRC 103695]|uniref:hypothetical protein n=1 Tax=Actinoplanes sp. NBRC 103695 TaxID=3032202 RepID=UPI0024A2C51E|nr:hypothetical protein [Actinoplanes sp. NBRC 103695]GLY96339.1 hypothetical protein Acsp02_35940 [Actinoplanes sp. NBRC 103695]